MFSLGDELKYRYLWRIGLVVTFLIYWSGILAIYRLIREHFQRHERRIILTYHRIRVDTNDPDISVNRNTFERQIRYLIKNFQVESVTNILKNNSGSKNGYKDKVALTFDDGYRDNYDHAYPLLKQNHLPATIFLVSQFVNIDDFLNLDQINEMKLNKIDFGSHTRTHAILSKVGHETARDEIYRSRSELEKLIEQPIDFFAYPKGKSAHYNDSIKSTVADAGYKAAFTNINGKVDAANRIYEINRIGIRECPMFVFKVRTSGLFETKALISLRKILGLT